MVGRQFAQAGNAVQRDTREHIKEPGERLDTAPLINNRGIANPSCRPPAHAAAGVPPRIPFGSVVDAQQPVHAGAYFVSGQ